MKIKKYILPYQQKKELLTLGILTLTTALVAQSMPLPTARAANASHIVISEIQISGTSATDEFVELYNPTTTAVSLDGWRLTRKTASGTESNLVANIEGTIPAHGYFLISHPDYDGSPSADILYSASSNSITSNNTVLVYSDASITLVDKVGMGEATDAEGAGTIVPDTDTSIERKAQASSSSESMKSGGSDTSKGNAEDTDNNDSDFVTIENPNPQNSNSQSEVPTTSSSPTPTNSANPTETVSPTPTGEITPTPTGIPQTQDVLISEIKVSGETATDEFIELYNPTSQDITMDEWILTKKTSTGTESTLANSLTGTIPAHGYYLIAHGDYGTKQPDTTYTTSGSIAANNTVLLYTKDKEQLLDKVGMGEASDFETAPSLMPATGETLERKAQSNSTSESMANGGIDAEKGNSYDTDNNSTDFVIKPSEMPQNSSSQTESLSGGSTPTPTINPSATPIPTTTPTNSPTTTPAPTLVPSATPTPTTTPEAPQGYTIGIFPLAGIVCRISYHPMTFGQWFTFFVPRISCSR